MSVPKNFSELLLEQARVGLESEIKNNLLPFVCSDGHHCHIDISVDNSMHVNFTIPKPCCSKVERDCTTKIENWIKK